MITTMPLTMSLYIGRRFLQAMLLALFGLVAIAVLIDTIELLRRASGVPGIPLSVLLEMALLKSPAITEKLLPFAVLAGSLLALTRLTRTQELVVARSFGVSVWQFLAPALVVAFAFGICSAAVFNPMSAALLLKFERMEGKYLSGKPSLLTVSSSGLWLRQIERNWPEVGEHIIYSLRISQSDMSFSNVIIFTYDKQGKFIERLDANTAALEPGELHLHGVIRSLPGHPPEQLAEYRLPTSLKIAHIQDSFASPETISFWKLPSFITVLERAGFSALRHRMYFNRLLSAPFLYCGMVLIAALFSLRLPRMGRIGQLITAGIVTGFFLHFFTNIASTLGMAGTLPILLSAWAPAAIIVMIGAGTLLHLEDG